MFNFHDFNLHTLTQFIQAHPYSSGIFAYFVCFFEAMAVIGALIPGAILMPAIGFLIGSAMIPAGSTFMWAILGALTGDILSYLLGVYFQNRIHSMWPFTRWPNLLVRSEKFFREHGGKSVFIGRFVGPTRAMIPMIAGMLKMSFLRFIIVIVPSASLWAVGYIAPGILLGALSLELPKKVAAEFTIGAFVAVIVLWLIVWLIKHFFKQIWKRVDHYIKRLWQYLRKHKETSWVVKFLSDPKETDNHWQLTLVIETIFMFILFLWVLYQVVTSGFLVDLSHSVYYLLSSLRFERLDHIFILVTFLGDTELLIITMILVATWILVRRQWYIALHLLGIMVLGGAVVSAVKFLIHSSRPGYILYSMGVPSFPSAHVALGLAFYGFLAVIIARELKETKKYFPYIIVGILVALISFSRIYLGAHWLVDILGGIFLGLMILLMVTIFYHRRHILHLRVREFALTLVGILTVVWVGYGAIGFGKQVKNYELIWPQQVIRFNTLIKGKDSEIPLYRLNRLGQPIEAFNVGYIGNLTEISQALLRRGWEPQPTRLNLQNMIKMLSTTSVVNHLTVFPQLYHNKKVALLFTKSTAQDGVALILRLWLSDIDLKDSDQPLWIGAIEYHHVAPNFFSLKNFKDKHRFVGATEFLAESLGERNFYLWKKRYPAASQPLEMRELGWDGKMLIIKSKH